MDERSRINRLATLAVFGAALFVLGLFFVEIVLSIVDPRRPVPAEMYPLATLAFGYLSGYRLVKGKE